MSELFTKYTFDDFDVRKAREDDVTAVYELLCDTAHWLKAKGTLQWEELLHEEGLNSVKEAISLQITYTVENNERDLVAVFNLSSNQNEWDIAMWGRRCDQAYYLHKLAVAETHHNKHIGRRILDWIDENIQLENGFVRLDCFADNNVLNQFYQGAGYEGVGYANMGEDTFSLYEKHFRF